MTETAILGTANTNTSKGSFESVRAGIKDELLLFDPANEALLVVPAESAKAFVQEANEMEALCKAIMSARSAVLDLEAKLDKANATNPPDHAAIAHIRQELSQAQKSYDKAYADVEDKLGSKGYLATSGNGKELLELIPLAKRKASGGPPQEWARKWTYVRSDKIKSHVRAYKLNSHEKGQPASFLKGGKVDVKALKEQFGKVNPKLVKEWSWAHGFMFPSLQAWAETLNQKSKDGAPVSFAAGVQLFRYFAGCGVTGEWNPKEGKIAGKFSMKAELMIAQGECKAEAYLPNEKGWAWALPGAKTGKEYHIGAFRFMGAVKLSAAAGASAATELSVEVNYAALGKPSIKGARRPKGPPTTSDKALLEKMGAEANAGADLFAGVKASGELVGELHYMNPEANSKFETLAGVGPKVEVQFGAGAAACLMVDYSNGKFRLRAKAGLCLGPGAKGEIGLEVDGKQLIKFMEWLFHALLNANFEFLQVLTTNCYEFAVKLQVMTLNGVQGAYSNISRTWDRFAQELERENQRVILMKKILNNPPELRLCLPEAHGIMLYQLTRHGNMTWAQFENTGWNFEALGERKKAVLQICKWAQTKRQFENIVQHISPSGTKGGFKGNFEGLLRFMEIGPFDSKYDDELRTLYTRLPIEPARGWPVALNDSTAFKTNLRMSDSLTYQAQLHGKNIGRNLA